MADTIAMVTGATGAIGKAVAAELAGQGGVVILVARSPQKAEAARHEINASTGHDSVAVMIADLASQASIRQLAEDFKRQYPRLDILINNAAVYHSTRRVTPDGLESMFAANHLAPFLLTNLLLEPLRAAGSARVLNVTAPSTVKLDFDDLQGEKKFRSLSAFGATKMANLLFTFDLARRLEGAGITVNAIHPGLVRSALMQEANPLMRFVVNLMSAPPERAAEPIVRVATAPEFAGVTGQFFHNAKQIEAAAYAHNPTAQQQLWAASAKLVKLEAALAR